MGTESIKLIVEEENKKERLDAYLAARMEGLSRSYIQRIIDEDSALVNGKPAKRNYRVAAGDEIVIAIPAAQPLNVEPEDIPLDIVYEDDDLLIVNKPAGMVVHPAPGNYSGTLVNALLAHCERLSGINGAYRPGIVHRIDKDTTGLLAVAKNERAHRELARQFKDHHISRKYIALVSGIIAEDAGIVDAPIGRHPVNRKKMAVVTKNSRKAVTHFSVIKRYSRFTLLELRLETGRTHQIRVHMAYIGHPVVGDPVYGKEGELGSGGQLLHAAELGFIHPVKGVYMKFEAPIPEEFQRILNELE
ncbi:MAG: RluA family pseudouridine synthase [Bacillota bacterium]|nr:RluA family pseudouridine synthase [Bacillota bacterium]